MIVYLDLIIIDNFAADYALLYLAVKTVKGKAITWRIALTALLGTALAVAYTIFTLYYIVPKYVEIILKCGVAAALPIIACKTNKKTTLLLCVAAYLAYTFAFAGLLTALFSNPKVNGGTTLSYTINGITTGVLVAMAVFFVWAARIIALRLSKRKKTLSFVVDCSLYYKERKIETRAFLDSGNRLTAPDGSPVLVAERSLALKVIGDSLFTKKTQLITIPVTTVNGKSKISAFKIDKIEIYYDGKTNIIEDVTLAISSENMQGEYNLIVPLVM